MSFCCKSKILNSIRSEEKVLMTKKTFYLRKSNGPSILGTKYDDSFGNLANEQYRHMGDKMVLAYFESSRGTEKYNTQSRKALRHIWNKMISTDANIISMDYFGQRSFYESFGSTDTWSVETIISSSSWILTIDLMNSSLIISLSLQYSTF